MNDDECIWSFPICLYIGYSLLVDGLMWNWRKPESPKPRILMTCCRVSLRKFASGSGAPWDSQWQPQHDTATKKIRLRLQDLSCYITFIFLYNLKIYKEYCPPPDGTFLLNLHHNLCISFRILSKERRRISRVGAAYRRRKESSASPHLTMAQGETIRPCQAAWCDFPPLLRPSCWFQAEATKPVASPFSLPCERGCITNKWPFWHTFAMGCDSSGWLFNEKLWSWNFQQVGKLM